MAKQVLGMDIGYSNLKLVFGDEGNKKSMIYPVGVVLEQDFITLDEKPGKDTLRVLVDDEAYIVGHPTEQMHAGWERTLSPNYSSTKEYKAMFHASLLASCQTVIDTLVTGLPVNQFSNEAVRNELVEMLKGKHQVTDSRAVTVKEVVVLPQPMGGYMTAVLESDDEDFENMQVLVIDPGFFSYDWTVIKNGAVSRGAIGTSMEAVSSLFETAQKIIFKQHGGRVSIESLESAIRNGKETVFLLGEKVLLAPILKEAAKRTGNVAMNAVVKSIRKLTQDIDAILLVGGGSDLFKESIEAAFPGRTIVNVKDSVLANANGFWEIGVE